MVKYWKSTRRSVQSKNKIDNPQKAELQIATLLFLYPFSGYACGNISFNEPAAYGLGKESAMTKHNAEMENSREQSRVCARLPLNLQLFAEDTGENGADTNGEGSAPAPVPVIAAMVKRAADCILVLAKRSFPLPE